MSKLRPVVEAENRLERFNADRDRIVDEVERRVMATLLDRAVNGGEWALEYVLNDCAYRELKRLEDRKDRGAHKQQQRWRELAHDLARMSDGDKQERLRQLIRHYAGDIVGNFNPRVYRFANDLLPPALGLLFTPASGWRKGLSALGELSGRIQVDGPVDLVRALTERGTLVVTPTHSSNMDSIAVGFGISRSGLPAMTYGAGKNLFTNPLISFFMHNLGAYRVDRRLRFGLYKQILKEYSTVLLESGYHSLFFPGGTRCRSNEVEQKLKLGLLGTAVTAFKNNAANGAAHRRIYIVPVTINYRLVLEAETLVDDYLAETGQSRYIITDDEFSRIGRVVEFMRKTMAHAGAVVLRFGQPRDPLGFAVNELGDSIDHRGRIIDPASYVTGRDGSVTDDEQRDAEYTRMLGTALAEDFRRETVFLSTSIVSRALYDAVAARHRTRDIYRLLRLTGADCAVSMAEAVRRVDRLRQRITNEPAYGRLNGRIREADPEAVVREAVAALGTYHTRPVAERRGDDIRIGYMKLLYYYQNRTSHIPAEREEGLS